MTEHIIVRARFIVLALFVGLCAWLVPGVTELQNDDDVLAFLPADHPDVIAFNEVADRYGMLELALVGLADGDADLLTPERMDRVREISQGLGRIDGVNIVLSAADLPHPIVNDEGLVVAPLVPEDMRDPAALRERVLSSTDAVGNFVSEDGKAVALLVFLRPRDGDGPEAFEARRATLAAVRSTVAEGWSGEVHLTGAPFIEMAASESSRGDIERLSPLVIAVLAIASALLLGSLTAAVLNLLVTGAGVGLIMGAHGVFGEPLTIVSSSAPVMMVALGGAFGVHMLAGYQRQSGTPKERASATVRELWLPVLLSGCTTAIAFFALLVMPQVPMQRFGLVAGVGVLLLLVLALLVMPALLAVLPAGLIKTRAERHLALPVKPPLWLLLVLAIVGGWAARSLEADADTINVFPESSEPRQAMGFFDAHFGGSTYLQVAVEGPMADNEVIRKIRDISSEVRAIEGVVDVRSVYDPMSVINAALGGRRGVPETAPRANRVLSYITGHPAMKQLMTDDGQAAIIHIKLAPMSGERQVELTSAVRKVLAAHDEGGSFRVGPTTMPAIAEARRKAVEARLAVELGTAVDFDAMKTDDMAIPPGFEAEIRKLRDQVFDSEEGAVAAEIPRAEIESLETKKLAKLRGAELEKYFSEKLPSLVEQDAEGVGLAAEFLGAWIDEAAGTFRAEASCVAVGAEDRCREIGPIFSEVEDEMWIAPAGVELKIEAEAEGETAPREVKFSTRLTGQPVIGQAFAESVTTSLWQSTLASIAALAVVLLLSRTLFALFPALWTLAFTAGIIALLGHSISVSTSMVSCIALGAGVDFAIHLGFRAREYEGAEAGHRAVDELGLVVIISAVQLGLAFLVLGWSELLPLQEFGVGLAVGLAGAALGAVWFTPRLLRGRGGKAAPSTSAKSAK